MAKRAKIEFVFGSLHLDIFLLKDILMSLPSDTKIVGFHSQSYIDQIHVESSSFRDIQAGQMLPNILVNFKNNPMGVPYLDSVDMSQALAAYNQAPTPTTLMNSTAPCSCNNYTICSPCINAATSSTVPAAYPPAPTYKGVGTVSFSLAGTNTAGFTGGCQHDWKTYDSSWSKYDFCTKCNEKKT